MRSRAELIAEYERVRLSEPRTALGEIEKATVMHTLQWVIWGSVPMDAPSEWIAVADQALKRSRL